MDQMVKASKKRYLEGTNLSFENFFALLDNSDIALIASNMGIIIPDCDFDKVEIMKDLEVARHNFEDKQNNVKNDKEEGQPVIGSDADQIPVLDWINEDSEEENFILVQSKKKKREQNKLKNSVSKEPGINTTNMPARRSKRTTPSIYRSCSGQENPGPSKGSHHNKYK